MPGGTIQFEGTLSQEEADVVIQLGLTQLFVMGVIPYTVEEDDEDEDDDSFYVEGSESVQ